MHCITCYLLTRHHFIRTSNSPDHLRPLAYSSITSNYISLTNIPLIGSCLIFCWNIAIDWQIFMCKQLLNKFRRIIIMELCYFKLSHDNHGLIMYSFSILYHSHYIMLSRLALVSKKSNKLLCQEHLVQKWETFYQVLVIGNR